MVSFGTKTATLEIKGLHVPKSNPSNVSVNFRAPAILAIRSGLRSE